MAKPKYYNGSGWCRKGQHYATPEDIKLARRGQRYCIEHKSQVRNGPRGKKWKAKHRQNSDTLKT